MSVWFSFLDPIIRYGKSERLDKTRLLSTWGKASVITGVVQKIPAHISHEINLNRTISSLFSSLLSNFLNRAMLFNKFEIVCGPFHWKISTSWLQLSLGFLSRLLRLPNKSGSLTFSHTPPQDNMKPVLWVTVFLAARSCKVYNSTFYT